MTDYKATLDRAFELAETGEYSSLNHIRQQLRREDRTDVHAQLSAPRINRELIAVLQKAARSAP